MGASFPNFAGTTQTRRFEISGDQLTIANPTPAVGSAAKVVLKRAKQITARARRDSGRGAVGILLQKMVLHRPRIVDPQAVRELDLSERVLHSPGSEMPSRRAAMFTPSPKIS